jgi:hydroxyethylthiazole kinase-like uncharacterized protein yjeF
MERAGLAVARLALARFPQARHVELLCGPGNNGGDGFVAARHLHAVGLQVRVRWIGDESQAPTDARAAIASARAAAVPIAPWSDDRASAPDLRVDALLGLGTNRPPQGALAVAIAACNGDPVPVLAVDLPSGLHPDTGRALAGPAVRATATLSLLTLKPGLFTGDGRDLAGEVWFDDLGVATATPSAALSGPRARSALPHATHKGSRGDVVIVGGAPGMVGAAWLAARAALAAGAGRVYISLLDDAASGLDLARPELMARRAWWRSPPAELAAATAVCGCGGGDRVRSALPPLLAHVPRLVLDADALNALAAETSLQTLLRHRADRGLATLLTPHPLEAARLLGSNTASVQSDRLAAASRLADRFGVDVVLKGSGSVIAGPGVAPLINPTGNAALATPGTGDVLAGWAAGSWAQRPQAPAWQIGAESAWLHGHAADRHLAAGRRSPLRAADLVEAMAAQLA